MPSASPSSPAFTAAADRQRLLKAVRLPSDSLLKLKNLMAFRDRLVKTRTSLKNTMHGLRETSHLIDNTLIVKLSQKQIKLVEQQIAQTEKEMQATIEQDQQLLECFDLAKSVIGISLIAASALLIHTQGFTAFESGRQFACYAGVAPFEHSSGSSVRGKTSTSHLANKKMKALLSNAAASAIQHDPQLKAYYHRKLGEGKEKMVVLNAVRANRTADAADQSRLRHRQPGNALRADGALRKSRMTENLGKLISLNAWFYLRIPAVHGVQPDEGVDRLQRA